MRNAASSSSNGFNPRLALLCHCGLLAQRIGQRERAEAIFAGLRPLLAEPAALDIARSLTHLLLREFDDAEALLNELLADAPQNEAALAALALVMRESGRHGWRPTEARWQDRMPGVGE